MDIQLFVRNSKGVVLTKEGEILYEYVKNALSLIERGETELRQMQRLEEGELRIGAGDTISRYLLLKPLEEFNKRYPKIKLHITNRTSRETLEFLKSGRIDLAFVNLPLEDDAVQTREYMRVQDIFVAGSRFEGLRNTCLQLEEVARLPLILLEKISNSRRVVEEFMFRQGIAIAPEIELGSHDLLLEFARINLGVSCVTREFSRSYLESDVLFELQTQKKLPERSIGICMLRGVRTSYAAAAFLEMLEQQRDKKQD